MQNTKSLIKNINPEDFNSKINLHIHTTCSDGVLTPRQVVEKAQEANLELFSITDHNSIQAYKEIELNDKVVTGVEFDCWHSYVFMHILGYGVDLENKELQDLCSTDKAGTELDIVRIFTRRRAKKVIETIKNAGGIAVIAHPACCWSVNLKNTIKELQTLGLDGMEVYYPYKRHRGIIKFYTINSIKKIAEDLDLLVTGGTDCHGTNILG